MEWHRKNFDSERRSPPDAGFPCGNPKGSEQGNFARPANKHPIRRKINPPVSLGQIPKATPSGLFPVVGVFLKPSRGGAAGFRCATDGTKPGPSRGFDCPVADYCATDSGKDKEGPGSSAEEQFSVADKPQIAGACAAKNHENAGNCQRGKQKSKNICSLHFFFPSFQ